MLSSDRKGLGTYDLHRENQNERHRSSRKGETNQINAVSRREFIKPQNINNCMVSECLHKLHEQSMEFAEL